MHHRDEVIPGVEAEAMEVVAMTKRARPPTDHESAHRPGARSILAAREPGPPTSFGLLHLGCDYLDLGGFPKSARALPSVLPHRRGGGSNWRYS